MSARITWDQFVQRAGEFFSDLTGMPEFVLGQPVDGVCRRCEKRCTGLNSNTIWIGQTRSCGCLRREVASQQNKSSRTYGWARRKLAEYQVGLISDISDSARLTNISKVGTHRFKCRCGRVFGDKVSLKKVLSGNTQSCGCLWATARILDGLAKRGRYTSAQQAKSDARASVPAESILSCAADWGLHVLSKLPPMLKTRDVILIGCRCEENDYTVGALTFFRGLKKSCGCLRSWGETEVYNFVKTLAPDAIRNTQKVIAPLECDIWVPSKGLAIEFNGLHWHSEAVMGDRAKTASLEKRDRLASLGFELVIIFEDEWTYRRSLIETKLQETLGLYALSFANCVADNRWPHEARALHQAGWIKQGETGPRPWYFAYGRNPKRVEQLPKGKKYSVVWDLGVTYWVSPES